MSFKSEQAYDPLFPHTSDDEVEANSYQHQVEDYARRRFPKWSAVIFILIIALNNAAWFAWQQLISATSPSSEAAYPPFTYTNSPFYQTTPYSGPRSSADDLWKSLFPLGNGVLSLPFSDPRVQHLPTTVAAPVRPGTGVYIVSGYHTLHCLTVLRSSLYHFRDGENQTEPFSHLVHCMDQIRQTMMCNLDTTLLAADDPDHFIDGQPHQCKDFWGLHRWMTEHAG